MTDDPALIAESVADWRATMEHPCTCPPRPSTDECPRVEECYEAWAAAQTDGRDSARAASDQQVNENG